jgi:hypothetical protein
LSSPSGLQLCGCSGRPVFFAEARPRFGVTGGD